MFIKKCWFLVLLVAVVFYTYLYLHLCLSVMFTDFITSKVQFQSSKNVTV